LVDGAQDGMPGLAWLRAWPRTPQELEEAQRALAVAAPRAAPWHPTDLKTVRVAAVFATFPTGRPGPGAAGEPAWAGAALMRAGAPCEVLAQAAIRGETGAPYVAGLLALRCGALLERAIGALEERPDLLLVDATARDHPRRAGLALHLGAVLDLPSVGVTNRPLLAACDEPSPQRGARSPLTLEGETVGLCLRTRTGSNPLFVHPGWRVELQTAKGLVEMLTGQLRTPEPLRRARTLARVLRARDEGRHPERGVE
jgi:deoxyribonuclease V